MNLMDDNSVVAPGTRNGVNISKISGHSSKGNFLKNYTKKSKK
tara:strand:+ start:660 stop:788 length:129 start_codon:yes stop_codon:yes gene_type:complete